MNDTQVNQVRLFIEQHTELDKFYRICVSDGGSYELLGEFASQLDECYVECPTNERADEILNDMLTDAACDVPTFDEITMSVEVREVTVLDDEYQVMMKRQFIQMTRQCLVLLTVTFFNICVVEKTR